MRLVLQLIHTALFNELKYRVEKSLTHVCQLITVLRYGRKILSIAQNVPIMIFTVQPLPPPLALYLLLIIRDQNKGGWAYIRSTTAASELFNISAVRVILQSLGNKHLDRSLWHLRSHSAQDEYEDLDKHTPHLTVHPFPSTMYTASTLSTKKLTPRKLKRV